MSAGMIAFSSHYDEPSSDVVSVPTRIAAHAAATPLRPAVSAPDAELTYGELDERAERLASALVGLGVGPESCVAVLLPRSARFTVAALAVLKAGGAYLPLDPATPASRIEYVLGDAAASVVMTDQGHAGGVPSGPWSVLDLDEVHDRPGVSSTGTVGSHPLAELERAEGLAYVIYTSGSTGRPKGVEITHVNLASLVDWHIEAFGVTADDRASQVAGLGFDAAVWEVWPHLAAGASVHVADEETHRSSQLLRDWLVARQITIAFAPTLLAEQLMQSDWPDRTALRTLLTGADRLNQRPLPGLPFEVVNNYGPTECTVVSTSGVVAPESDTDGPPSIGAPLPGTVAMILDADLRPVGEGEPGELVVAGPHVGRGYRHDPDRTVARFVVVPTASGERVRAYRTGDRVRRLADGRLAFLGRLDDQVKVRGYRIEPAEIVSWLLQCPGVDAAAATAVGDGDDKELVAHVVVTGGRAPSVEDIRSFLAVQLPEYMVPAHVMFLTALPTTPNGKLDTSALPRPEVTMTPEPSAGDPGSSVRAWVQELVAELLTVPHVDVDDNIFLLGGHSMLAMQVVSKVRAQYGVQLSLRQLFRGPTVASIASQVTEQQVGA